MPVTIVAGVQWGDEGKGKIIDVLAQDADFVVRCQGGPNAGHTVVNEHGKFVLHGLPSGMFAPNVLNILAPGTVVNPSGLAGEIAGLATAGFFSNNLLISDRAHVILEAHRALDVLMDGDRPESLRVGSTDRKSVV